MEHIDEPGMILRDLFILLDPLELAFEGPFEFKILTPHHFDGPIHARDRAAKIDLSVRTSADAAEELEVGDLGAVGCPGDTGL
jgi:hypothetical protein